MKKAQLKEQLSAQVDKLKTAKLENERLEIRTQTMEERMRAHGDELDAEKIANDRVDMHAKVVEFEARIKAIIVHTLVVHSAEFDKIRELVKKALSTKERWELDSYRDEIEKIRTQIKHAVSRVHQSVELVPTPVNWATEVRQEWLIYWNIPTYLNGGGQPIEVIYEISDRDQREDLYAYWYSYKGDEYNVNIVSTIVDRYAWKAKFGIVCAPF